MIKRINALVLIALTGWLVSCSPSFSERSSMKLADAQVEIKGNHIVASTGCVTREWELSPSGLKTIAFSENKNKNQIHNEISVAGDWALPWMSSNEEALLIGARSYVDNDDGFANDFIRTEVEFEYPVSGIGLKYDIWTLPGSNGFRTQIHLRKLKDNVVVEEFADGIVEQLDIDQTITKGKAIGYYNDTQHRNKKETPILKEKYFNFKSKVAVAWANAFFVLEKNRGIVLVKESHKCVNQQGVNTGGFILSPGHVGVSGTGLDSSHLTTEYQPCWATWSIIYEGDEDHGELALKKFDRTRYPINPDKGIYIMSNTWGSSQGPVNGRYASREENILREIASAKDLGIDLLQIDDGWQGQDYQIWRPAKSAIYNGIKGTNHQLKKGTKYSIYPTEWNRVKAFAKESNVDLGLWASWEIPHDDLVWNNAKGGFKSYKLDFAYLNNYGVLSQFMSKIRSFVLSTNHNVRVNWDVTENAPRMGYYLGREYGNIYLENRKPDQPINVLYHPWLVLRDAWQVSKYTNINKFQVSVQNIDRVNKKDSDAYLHNHPYVTAIALCGSPIFFQETQYYNDKARKEIRPMIAGYKKIRNELYAGYMFPVGDEPTNSSWSGFQNVQENMNEGFLMAFREINNQEKEYGMFLRFLNNRTLELTDIYTGEKCRKQVDGNGMLILSIEKPADFRFWKYKIIKKK